MPKKKIKPVAEEVAAEEEAEAKTHFKAEPSAEEVGEFDEEADKGLVVEEGADAEMTVPAEVAAIHTDNETAKAVNKKIEVTSKRASQSKRTRSQAYLKAKAQIEPGKLYKLVEAIELVKKVSTAKFDASIEIHLKLTAKKAKQQNESQRGVFNLPHGSGKIKNIIILDEKKIEEIAKTKKLDFDIALASPDLMPKVAKIAKILGPKGKMPDPKSGTVTTNPQKTIEEINKGKVEYRIDGGNNVHQIIGKVSWTDDKLQENIQAILSAFPKSKLEAVYLAASIGPAVSLDLKSLT